MTQDGPNHQFDTLTLLDFITMFYLYAHRWGFAYHVGFSSLICRTLYQGKLGVGKTIGRAAEQRFLMREDDLLACMTGFAGQVSSSRLRGFDRG